jgi:hypothetical protein
MRRYLHFVQNADPRDENEISDAFCDTTTYFSYADDDTNDNESYVVVHQLR